MHYTLSSGEALHAEFPESFGLPDRAERDAVPVGGLVKLIFNFGQTVERMWVQVTHCHPNGGYLGSLNSHPLNGPLKFGSAVSFRPEHIIQIWQCE